MTTRSYIRGNETEFSREKGEWVYKDTKESVKIVRPCKRCGRMPTKEGYDACLGYISGAKSACCGHGVKKGFVLKEERRK